MGLSPTNERTRTMPEHADQTVDHWAAQGIAQSPERESAESNVVETALSAPAETADPHSEALDPPTADVDPLTEVERPNTTAHPTLDGELGTTTSLEGQPGSTDDPGDQAEHAGFQGDGAYSEGQAAGQNYHAGGVQD